MSPEQINLYTYCVISDGDGYSAYVAECRGCMTCGDTIEEAFNNLDDALTAWLNACKKHGQEIPQPRNRIIFDDDWRKGKL